MTIEERITELERQVALLEAKVYTSSTRLGPARLITREEIERGIKQIIDANKGDVDV